MNGEPSAVRRPLPLILGTAQLGLAYGLRGRPMDDGDSARILDAAAAAGIAALDTARDYGEAERRIGAWLAGHAAPVSIVSKCPSLDRVPNDAVADTVTGHWTASARGLGRDRIDGYLTHGPRDIARPAVRRALRRLQDQGRIGGFGASVYTAEEALAALAVPGLSLLQLPFSIANRTLQAAGVLDRAGDRGVRVQARSVFLQGSLLTAPDSLPGHLAPLAPVLARLGDLAGQSGRPVVELLVQAVLSCPGVSDVVLGADSPAEVAMAAGAVAAPPLDEALAEALFDAADGLPPAVTDPRLWQGADER